MREIIEGRIFADPYMPRPVAYTLRYGACSVRDFRWSAAHRNFELRRWRYYLSTRDYKIQILTR